jgi:hypothetical protein
MWDVAQARLIRIQNSVKRLKFSKGGVKKGCKEGKKMKKANKNKRVKRNRKKF